MNRNVVHKGMTTTLTLDLFARCPMRWSAIRHLWRGANLVEDDGRQRRLRHLRQFARQLLRAAPSMGHASIDIETVRCPQDLPHDLLKVYYWFEFDDDDEPYYIFEVAGHAGDGYACVYQRQIAVPGVGETRDDVLRYVREREEGIGHSTLLRFLESDHYH